MPTFKVRLFAAHREAAGKAFVSVELDAGARVADVREALERNVPALASAASTTVIAVNGQFSDDKRPLRPGDEIAAFPPVAGG